MSLSGIRCISREAVRIGALLLVSTVALTACGQKGPLYLPDRGATVAQPPTPVPGAAPGSEDRDKDEAKPR